MASTASKWMAAAGQAIGALEIWFDKLAKRVGRVFRRRRLKIDLAAAE